jgi:hypothetical protein
MNDSEPGRETTTVVASLRELTVDALSRHVAQDRISIEEFERRTAVAYAARTSAELEYLLSDLPDLPNRSTAESTGQDVLHRTASRHGLVVNVLGGSERRGRWTPAPRMLAMTVAGGVLLDFRDALFATSEVEVTILVLLGGATEVLVPPNVRVELTGIPVLGSLEHETESANADADAPLLNIRAYSILGTVKVKVLPSGQAYQPDW